MESASQVPSPILFFDIAGPDDGRLRTFYTAVFGWTFDNESRVSVTTVSPLEGAVRKDPAEKRIYIGVPDVTETLSLVEAHGGTVDAPRFEVPGVVVLGLFRDPAGNAMGLVEMEGTRPRVP